MKKLFLAAAAVLLVTSAPLVAEPSANHDLSNAVQLTAEQVCAKQTNQGARLECEVDFGLLYIYARASEIGLMVTNQLIALGAKEEAQASVASDEEAALVIKKRYDDLLAKYDI